MYDRYIKIKLVKNNIARLVPTLHILYDVIINIIYFVWLLIREKYFAVAKALLMALKVYTSQDIYRAVPPPTTQKCGAQKS